MVTDIVKQLRDASDGSLGDEGDLYLDAAHHIETMRKMLRVSLHGVDALAEIERLKAAMAEIGNVKRDAFAEIDRLKAALAEIGNAKRFGVTPQTELAQSALRGSE